MLKNNSEKNQRKGRNGNGKKGNSESNSSAQAILQIAQPEKDESKCIKATFTDTDGEEVKEYVRTYRNGQPKELLIELLKEVVEYGDNYELYSAGR